MAAGRKSSTRLVDRWMVAISALALCTFGCQNRGNISGKVTYKDKPVTYGTVLVVGKDGASVQAPIKDGAYYAPGVAVGEAQVAVNSPDPKHVGENTGWKPHQKKPEPLNIPGWFAIPQKYETITTSDLKYQVKGGDNKWDIDLK